MLRKKGSKRSGMEVVEAAIALPVLVISTFMTIDVCNTLHLKQVANTVAFEAARAASKKDATFDSAKEIGEQFAEARGLNSYTITVESHAPSVYKTRASLPVGYTLRAYVEVPVKGNVTGPFFLFQNSVIQSQKVRLSAR